MQGDLTPKTCRNISINTNINISNNMIINIIINNYFTVISITIEQ